MPPPKLTWVMKDGTLLESDTWPDGAVGIHPNGASVPKSLFPGLFQSTPHNHKLTTMNHTEPVTIAVFRLDTTPVKIGAWLAKKNKTKPDTTVDVREVITQSYHETVDLFKTIFSPTLSPDFIVRMAVHFVNATIFDLREKVLSYNDPDQTDPDIREEIQMTMFDTLLDYVYQTEEYVCLENEKQSEAEERLETTLADCGAKITKAVERAISIQLSVDSI